MIEQFKTCIQTFSLKPKKIIIIYHESLQPIEAVDHNNNRKKNKIKTKN